MISTIAFVLAMAASWPTLDQEGRDTVFQRLNNLYAIVASYEKPTPYSHPSFLDGHCCAGPTPTAVWHVNRSFNRISEAANDSNNSKEAANNNSNSSLHWRPPEKLAQQHRQGHR